MATDDNIVDLLPRMDQLALERLVERIIPQEAKEELIYTCDCGNTSFEVLPHAVRCDDCGGLHYMEAVIGGEEESSEE